MCVCVALFECIGITCVCPDAPTLFHNLSSSFGETDSTGLPAAETALPLLGPLQYSRNPTHPTVLMTPEHILYPLTITKSVFGSPKCKQQPHRALYSSALKRNRTNNILPFVIHHHQKATDRVFCRLAILIRPLINQQRKDELLIVFSFSYRCSWNRVTLPGGRRQDFYHLPRLRLPKPSLRVTSSQPFGS